MFKNKLHADLYSHTMKPANQSLEVPDDGIQKQKLKTEKKTSYFFFPYKHIMPCANDTDKNSFRLQKLRTWGLYLLHMIANKFSETKSVQN